MIKSSQKEAVFQAVANVTGHSGDSAVVITKEQRAQVNLILFQGFREETIELDREYTDTDLKAYVSGLQSNWLRKDKRLNGNTKYAAANPGSRAGQTDPSLKAMRALLSTLSTEEDKQEVQAHIDSKVAEIYSTKQAKAIDFSSLPTILRAKFSK